RLGTLLIGGAILAVGVLPTTGQAAAAQPGSSMSVRILAPKSHVTIAASKPVSMHIKVTGIALDLKHIGKKPVAGHGHIQLYLDKVPSDAYKKVDTKNLVVVVG